MRKLTTNEMQILQGGSWDCAVAIGGVALSIAGFLTVPAGGIGAAAVAAGGHLLAVYGLQDCQ